MDEEGWQLDGYVLEQNGQINLVKGKGKGKGCFNCGESGRYARECPKPTGKGKSKGKADDRLCYNCGKSGHISRNCPNQAKGKGKGKAAKGSYYGGKASWSQPSHGIKSLCSVVTKPRVQEDLEGFVKATNTVRAVANHRVLSLVSKPKFFPTKIENSQEQVLEETKGLESFEKHEKRNSTNETSKEKTKGTEKSQNEARGNGGKTTI